MTSTSSEPKTGRPKYAQFAGRLRRQIETGELKPGDRLPSFAQMLARHGLGQGTVERMYGLLEQEGLVVREPNRGTYVAEPKQRATTGAIGLLVETGWLSQHPYHVQLLAAIQDAAHQRFVETIFLHGKSQIGLDKVDGLLMMHVRPNRVVAQLPADMPAVSLMFQSGSAASVIADDSAGIRAAMEHLLGLGHTRIAYLTGAVQEWTDVVSLRRLDAYRGALASAGITPDKRWLRPVIDPIDEPAHYAKLGYAKMARWIRRDWRELRCTALMAHNDDVAMGAVEALQDAGIRVPEEVSVIGFDNTEVAEAFRPRLTSVEVPLRQIGIKGVETLLDQIASIGLVSGVERKAASTIVLPTELIVRESTAAAIA